ncbi:hypothetical protein JXA88_03065 [Candidatus Fermentibacteria bacterium]|nr:hypothetical protein [Candidatus Fermentibacteria bacterium]
MRRALGMHELLVGVAVLALFGALLFFSPRLYGYSLMEDLPPEWFQFFCLAAAAWWWGKAAVGRWNKGWAGFLFCCALAALSAFVAGEEISWGHRVFGYETPAYFAYRNVQNEPTLHNLARQLVEPRGAAIAVMLGYGIVLPLLTWGIRPFGRWARRANVPVPNPGTAVVFALAIWLMGMPFTATDDEVGEGFFALGLLFAAFTAAGGVSGSSLLRRVGTLVAVSLVTSAFCFLRPAHREQVFNVGHLQAAQAYEGLGMRWEAAREYESLARYWQTDWELWVKVINLSYEAGDLKKAFDLSAEFITINKRMWRPFEVMAEIGRIWGIEDEVRRRIRDVLIDEPYNDYARWALLILEGRRPFYGEEVKR